MTAGTYQKEHYFGSRRRLRFLHDTLLWNALHFGWHLEAWAVFSNHYHFVAHSPANEKSAESLRVFLTQLHSQTAGKMNGWDETPGRKVWHNYWETLLTFESSYFARLSYVHQNPVKHGMVPVASQYSWCSAGWYEGVASPSQLAALARFDLSQVNVYDDYVPYRK